MAITDYMIYLLDSSGNRSAVIDGYQRLSLYLRDNALGSWLLELDSDSAHIDQFQWLSRIAVYRKGQRIFTGLVEGLTDSDLDLSSGRFWAHGPDYYDYLDRRVALPDPAGPPFTLYEHDIRTGPAGNIIIDYADYNLGPSAQVVRRISGLVMGSKYSYGNTISGNARFDNLLVFLQQKALEGGDIRFGFDGETFKVTERSDKSNSVIFSKRLDTLVSYTRKVKRAISNFIYAGGGGEGTSRDFIITQDSDSLILYGRREEFYDLRNAADTTELIEGAQGRLLESAETIDITLKVRETNSQQYQDDYILGDIVRVEIPGYSYSAAIREVQLELSTRGENIFLTIGTPGATSARENAMIYKTSRSLSSRISQLERR